MKNKWKAFLAIMVVVALMIPSYAFSARYEELTVTKLKVKTVQELNSTDGLAITSPTISGPTISDPTITGTITATGGVSAANIADVTRSFALQLGAGGVDGGNDVDDASTPDLTTCDGIPCLVWASSSETTAVGWTFRLPSDFVSSLVVYAFVSSNAASGSGQLLDWCIWENIDGTTFDAACIPQAAVECTCATLNASNEVLTLTSDATAETAYTAGDWITLEFFNASTDDDDLELKGLEVTYTATQ